MELTLKEIFIKEYHKQKKVFLAYVTICVFVASFFGPFVSDSMYGTKAKAEVELTDVADLADMANIDSFTVTSQISNQIFKRTLKKLVGDYSGIIGVSAEPLSGLLFLSALDFTNRLLDKPLDMDPLPIGQLPILITLAVFFIISKVMRTFNTTKVIGECTLGMLEKYLGIVCVMAIGVLFVTGVATKEGANVAHAAGLDTVAGTPGIVLTRFATAVIALILAVASFVINFIIRTVTNAVKIIQLIFSQFPVVSGICEAAKTIVVVGYTAFMMALTHTQAGVYVALVIDTIIFIICCFLFKFCYNISYYYNSVYIKPVLRGIFKRKKRKVYPLMPRKIPHMVKKAFTPEELESITCIIPIYTDKKSRASTLAIKHFRKYYLVKAGNDNYVVLKKSKKHPGRKELLAQDGDLKVYISKGLYKYTLFRYIDSPENLAKKHPSKDFAFAITVDYKYRIDEVTDLFGYTSYNEEKKEKKARRKEARAERRAQRAEERREAIEEFKYYIKSIFQKNTI